MAACARSSATLLVAAAAVLAGCVAAAPPIQLAATSRSHFEKGDYAGETVTFEKATPGEESYRAFEQANTPFVALPDVRARVEARGAAYCRAKGRVLRVLAETEAKPPYIQGHYPRVELIFECLAAAAVR